MQSKSKSPALNKPCLQNREDRSNPKGADDRLPRDISAAIGGPVLPQTYQEADIEKAIGWFSHYLVSEREEYFEKAQVLSPDFRKLLDGYFEPALLDLVRVLELRDRRLKNPWFYPQAREKGVRHLPDISHKIAVTFFDTIVFNENIGSRDLFHGMVHVAQIRVLGLQAYSEAFVRGFLAARSYFLVPLKAHAFELDAKFAAQPGQRFSVEREVWNHWQAGRY